MCVGSAGMANHNRRASDSGTPCRQEFCDAPHLQQTCGQCGAAADHSARHATEQTDVHHQRRDGIPDSGEQFAGCGAADC